MYELLLLTLWGPPPSDLGRFPGYGICSEQIDRCVEHKARLRWYRYTGGHLRYGHLDAAIAETEFRKRVWQALAVAYEAPAERWQRLALADLKALIGDERYLAGWRPPLLPEAGAFRSGPPIMPRAERPSNP